MLENNKPFLFNHSLKMIQAIAVAIKSQKNKVVISNAAMAISSIN